MLNKSEIERALETLDGWEFEEDALTRTLTFGDFKEAMAFMVRAGFEAEAQGHHPEWFNVYNRVEIVLSTHDAGGKVTEKDIKLAQAIDKLVS
ncbi:MAG: 4a-hydroxytetrahydrobiopterin dehydratase [Balneolaceae bacterium]|nr:MAG: 4a-hydroxytetrahydrobiopterin dehydratase [Balneolaceae bacterium]